MTERLCHVGHTAVLTVTAPIVECAKGLSVSLRELPLPHRRHTLARNIISLVDDKVAHYCALPGVILPSG
ncbi:protein of unknown function [Candidatus Filomicrobium marinum]|uniref:Uncharacterized protein n=1 Tax=Candidatus Filomicrobium marinum TaxID=1608628 RepID=A0A0D6JIZ6_9HYPH|nr:protein of unknown function [Candidatus Filomicrobium marinum]CPR21459.1 protein of unknown function [Candidatus Filomicrobium marinum]